ncbi:MAG TPA: hypothetical protein VIC28_14850 [Thermoanaerobaculia bacterium]|jgi:hypothetical protein
MRDWSLITCPRCDFEQSEADECARCGVIFAKLRRAAESWRASAATAEQIYRPLPRAAVTSQEARLEIRLFLFLTFLFSALCYEVYFLSVIHLWELPGGGALFVGLFQWAPGPVVGLTFLFTWPRMRSRSLWPALFLHASCNGAYFGLDALTERTTTMASYVVCQDGAGFAVLTWLFIAVSWPSMRASLRASMRSNFIARVPPRR